MGEGERQRWAEGDTIKHGVGGGGRVWSRRIFAPARVHDSRSRDALHVIVVAIFTIQRVIPPQRRGGRGEGEAGRSDDVTRLHNSPSHRRVCFRDDDSRAHRTRFFFRDFRRTDRRHGSFLHRSNEPHTTGHYFRARDRSGETDVTR